MKLSISLLYLASLGVCAENSGWIAVLHRNHSGHGLLPRHRVMLEDLGGTHQHSFELGSFRGYAFSGSEDAAARIAQHHEVAYVEPDHTVSAYGMVNVTTPNWNLAAISHTDPIVSNTSAHRYVFDDAAGEGTVVYVLDSGIDIKHAEFEGRAEWGMTAVAGKLMPELQVDDFGHGTHVAGIVGSRTYGVAKKTRLVAVKVLNSRGKGLFSDVIRGILWAHEDAARRGALGRAVINLSLGHRRWANATANATTDAVADATMDAVAEVSKGGVFVVAAAGNNHHDARRTTPGAAPEACTVGAHDARGRRAPFSNRGPGVDVWAPGVRIPSVVAGGPPARRTTRRGPPGPAAPKPGPVLSGTSQAAPHVAGVAAYLMSRPDAPPGAAPGVDWCARIRAMGKAAPARSRGPEPVEPEPVEPLLYNGAGGPAFATQASPRKTASGTGPRLPPPVVAKESGRVH